MTGTEWTTKQDQAGKLQGWALFGMDDGSCELQRIDFPDDDDDPELPAPPVFDDDEAAHAFVKTQAEGGDALALAALAYLREHPAPYDCPDCDEEHNEGVCPKNRLNFATLHSAIVNAITVDIANSGARLSCGYLQAVPLGEFARALHERLKSYTSEPGIFCQPCNESADRSAERCASCGEKF